MTDNVIILKKSSTASSAPIGADLEPGEIAINLADKKLYSKTVGGTIIEVGRPDAADLLALLLTVDGAASLLDADKLDGQEGSYYTTATNLSSGTIPAARLPAPTTTAAGAMELATTAEFRNKTPTKSIDMSIAYAGAAVVALTDGANIALNLDSGINFSVTLAGNRVLDNPTNLDPGQAGFIRVTQDGTGSRTLSFGSYYKFDGGVAPTLLATASSVSVLFYYVLSSTEVLVSVVRGVA